MTIQEIIEVHQKCRPDLWNICNPRIYRDIQDYGRPKLGALTYIGSIVGVSNSEVNASSTTQNIYIAATIAQQFNFPSFFITQELLVSIANTDVPREVMWQEMLLPFESGIFYLPKSVLQHPTEGSCEFLGWVRARQGVIYQFLPNLPRGYVDADKFIIFTGLPQNEKFPILDYVVDARYATSTGDAIREMIINEPRAVRDLPMGEGESDFLIQCKSLVFGILLAMQARPNLISHGNNTNKIHKKSGREIWEPNIVGKGYEIPHYESDGQGAHSRPRLHWRRGHYRQQPYGVGRESIKTIWIEPMLVGEISSTTEMSLPSKESIQRRQAENWLNYHKNK